MASKQCHLILMSILKEVNRWSWYIATYVVLCQLYLWVEHNILSHYNDYSRKVWACLLRQKDQVLLVFQHFVIMVKTQTGKWVNFLHSKNGGAYLSKYF